MIRVVSIPLLVAQLETVATGLICRRSISRKALRGSIGLPETRSDPPRGRCPFRPPRGARPCVMCAGRSLAGGWQPFLRAAVGPADEAEHFP